MTSLDNFFDNIKYTLKCNCDYCNKEFIKYKTCILLMDSLQQYYFNFYIPIEIQKFIINLIVTYDLILYINRARLWQTANIKNFSKYIEFIFNDQELRRVYYDPFRIRYHKYHTLQYDKFNFKIKEMEKIMKNHTREMQFSLETLENINKKQI